MYTALVTYIILKHDVAVSMDGLVLTVTSKWTRVQTITAFMANVRHIIITQRVSVNQDGQDLLVIQILMNVTYQEISVTMVARV